MLYEVITDEPLSALDHEMRENLQNEILKAHDLLQSITMLVSHDVKEVEKLATSVVLLQNGKIKNQGKTSEVLNQLNL